MFKRVTWMGVGMVAGLGASKWLERKARRRLARYFPGGRVALSAGTEARDWARELATGTLTDLRHAVDEGRRTMEARQIELRRQLRLREPSREDQGDVSTVGRWTAPAAPIVPRATGTASGGSAPADHHRSRPGREGKGLAV